MKTGLDILRRNQFCRALGWASLPLFPMFCWGVLEYYNFGSLTKVLGFVRSRTGPVLFGLLVVGLAFVLVLLVFRRAAAACAVTGGISFGLAYINYMKLALNGNHFFPKDVQMAKQAGSLLSFLSGGLPKWMGPALAVFLIWCVGLAVLGTALPRGVPLRPFCAASLAALCLVFCADGQRTIAVLNRFDIYIEDTRLQSINYERNGFVGAFALNLQSMNIKPPAGYSRETMEELLAEYQGTPSAQENFDVILVLSESFSDIREMPELAFEPNPLTNYDAIRERDNCYSGRLYSNAFAGGTVRPEFEILTGLDSELLPDGATPHEYIKRSLAGYVSHYKDAGYQTVALHPYLRDFYDRSRAYPLLGFDAFYGLEDFSKLGELDFKRGYASDASLERIMESVLEEMEAPAFLFAITMEGHQPYDPLPAEEQTVTVTSGLTQEATQTVTTYTQCLYDADQMLGRLADFVDRRERPTVLIFFGDHRPALLAYYEAHDENDLFLNMVSYEYENMLVKYSTPFLIYANRTLDPGLFHGRTENELSTYYLLEAAARCTGFQETPYMELLGDFYQIAPVYNDQLNMPLTPELEETIQARRLVTYDRLLGEGYTQ